MAEEEGGGGGGGSGSPKLSNAADLIPILGELSEQLQHLAFAQVHLQVGHNSPPLSPMVFTSLSFLWFLSPSLLWSLPLSPLVSTPLSPLLSTSLSLLWSLPPSFSR